MTMFNSFPSTQRARAGLAGTALVNKLHDRLNAQTPVPELGEIPSVLDFHNVCIIKPMALYGTKVGWYDGVAMAYDLITNPASADVDLADFFVDSGEDRETVVIANVAEIRGAGGPLDLGGDTYLIGVVAGFVTDTEVPIVIALLRLEVLGQYQGMVHTMVSQNQDGWDFFMAVSPVPFIIP